MSDLDHAHVEALRLIDRHRYYGETLPADVITTLEDVVRVDIDDIARDAFEDGRAEGQGEVETDEQLLERIETLESQLEVQAARIVELTENNRSCREVIDSQALELKTLRIDARGSSRKRATDPFKGKSPAQMRNALRVIYGALNDITREDQ